MKKINQFFAILKPVFRGVLKSIPIGNILVELSQNKKAKKTNEHVIDSNGEQIPAELPHNYVSIAIQIICVVGIIYAFYTKQIDLNHFLSILQSIIN